MNEVRIENLGRSKWVLPIVEHVGEGAQRRLVEKDRVVIGDSFHKIVQGERGKNRPSPVVVLTKAQWNALGKDNQALIDDLEQKGELEVRPSLAERRKMAA